MMKIETSSPIQIPGPNSGICNEQILILVFERLKWDIHALCHIGSVSCRLRALAHRLLWRELCLHRAPRMTLSLTDGSSKRIGGGWLALAKLMFFCMGCQPTRHFELSRSSPSHFVKVVRFSKTSGRSFLIRGCSMDELHVSDPCEHLNPTGPVDRKVDLGLYRGVFRSFTKSRTREFLIQRRVGFEEGMRCPFCGGRVWSMTAARLIPRRRAARRLGTRTGKLEYFVCLHGHLYGACWLFRLPTGGEPDGINSDDDDFMDSGDDNDDMEV
ncbi:hypothetical protein CASFOL_008868 [Castilleja foliolosa]|uniref:EID1-like F-box protein 3 n=1 Tax=Castilleja foliolosa TaxID=1961234 RepID=A0ABD3E077_9LAMI